MPCNSRFYLSPPLQYLIYSCCSQTRPARRFARGAAVPKRLSPATAHRAVRAAGRYVKRDTCTTAGERLRRYADHAFRRGSLLSYTLLYTLLSTVAGLTSGAFVICSSPPSVQTCIPSCETAPPWEDNPPPGLAFCSLPFLPQHCSIPGRRACNISSLCCLPFLLHFLLYRLHYLIVFLLLLHRTPVVPRILWRFFLPLLYKARGMIGFERLSVAGRRRAVRISAVAVLWVYARHALWFLLHYCRKEHSSSLNHPFPVLLLPVHSPSLPLPLRAFTLHYLYPVFCNVTSCSSPSPTYLPVCSIANTVVFASHWRSYGGITLLP